MAILGPMFNARVAINGVDHSDHVTNVTIETERDEHDITGMGATNKVNMPGLGDVTISVDVLQDFAAGEIDDTMFPLSQTSTPFLVAIRPVNAAISTTNPEYQLTALMYGYAPIDGGLDSPLSTTLTFRNAAQTGLVRDVTP